MSKTTVYIMIIGLVVGILLEIMFPQILLFEFKNNIDNLSNLSELKGSVYAVGFWFPVLVSAISGFLTETFIRLYKNYRKR